MLKDVLAPNLKLVICGTAVGDTSARLKQYYAKPSNKFWRVLHQVALTPRLLVEPRDVPARKNEWESPLQVSDLDKRRKEI